MAPDDLSPGSRSPPLDGITPLAGSIWSVPAVGRMCVIMSRPTVRDGQALFYALPLYTREDDVAAHSALDFLIDATESSLGMPLFGAFWNTRPLSTADLGRELGRVTQDQLLIDLYLLRTGIEEKRPRHWRLGSDAALTSTITAARTREVGRWVSLPISRRDHGRLSQDKTEWPDRGA